MEELHRHLDAIIQRYQPVGPGTISLVAEAATVRDLARDEHLVQAGGAERHEYFILEGMLHRHVLDATGERVTSAFHPGGTVLTPHFARTVNGHSLYDLQALEPSRVAAVPVETFDRLRATVPELRLFGLRVVERELVSSIRQSIGFRERSARDRLLELRREHPGLENRVPHTVIASYLGITPVSLSRLRKELAHAS